MSTFYNFKSYKKHVEDEEKRVALECDVNPKHHVTHLPKLK